MEVGEERDYILIVHCHHQNDSCIKTGSDESYFNVSLIVRDKVSRQRPQTTTFDEKRAEADSNRGPSAYQRTDVTLTIGGFTTGNGGARGVGGGAEFEG